MSNSARPGVEASHSGNGVNCVEAGSVPGAILIRDTRDRQRGPVLRFSANAWRRSTAKQTNK